MAKVWELIPGDRVTNETGSAIFICRTDHPLHQTLKLVVWRIERDELGVMQEGAYSFDALSALQEVGTREISTGMERKRNLIWALGGDISGAVRTG